MTNSKPVDPAKTFFTVSGKPLVIGTGSGTKWQWLKKGKALEDNAPGQELVDQLLLALNNGFYHIDTAEFYTTHHEVGEAVKQSGIKREDLWITSKYSPYSGRTVTEAIDITLKELDTEYLDFYLIHTPFFKDDSKYSIEMAWKDMVEVKKQGKARYIGVSNFTVEQLERVFKTCEPEFYPSVNQVEFHAYLQDQTVNITDFCVKHNILLESYGPLSPLFRVPTEGESHPLKDILPKLSENYGKTESQILLRYVLQKGYLPITTSSKVQRIKESLDIYQFELSQDDINLIDTEGSKLKVRGFFNDNYD